MIQNGLEIPKIDKNVDMRSSKKPLAEDSTVISLVHNT